MEVLVVLENEFENFLLDDAGIKSKDKAVASRMSKARAVERTLNTSLDFVVSDDRRMYEALVNINQKMKNSNGAYSNALRKYYTFINKRDFPQIKTYEYYNS